MRAREYGTKSVEVATGIARAGTNLGLHVEIAHLGQRSGGSRPELQLAGQCQIALKATFLARDFFIEARVFDGDRQLRRAVMALVSAFFFFFFIFFFFFFLFVCGLL